MQTKILVIDDEEPICEILKYNLEKEGYEVDCAYSAEEALAMNLEPYQLFIVDIMMDQMSGFDFARRIKNNAALSMKPILFCSAMDGEDEIIKGLNIGADDYITKPFQVGVVMARVKAALRKSGVRQMAEIPAYPAPQIQQPAPPVTIVPNGSNDIVFRTLRVNLNDKTCNIGAQKINLTRTEFDMLVFFLRNRSRIFSREEIIQNVWGEGYNVSNRSVDTNITRLRNKIGQYRDNLITRQGFGYGFEE